jgi:hypothetical protein
VCCVLRVLRLCQLVVLRWPPQPPPFGDFPRKGAVAARLPLPASGHAQSENQTYNLSVATPALSPVKLTRDMCACLCVRAHACAIA